MLLMYGILFGVYFIFILDEKFAEDPKIRFGQSGVFSISALFFFLSARHFYAPADYADMAPFAGHWGLPLSYAVGVFLGICAIGLLVWKTQKVAAVAMMLFLAAALPFHFYGAVHSVGPDHDLGPMYIVMRIPSEFFMIWWVWRFGTFQTPLRELRDPGKLVD
ncbi:MAG: hypothetical protein COB53_11235 [Elusimicrobia bacterium]|nr:MAG: hypothetical protein COB53_11235 [Elusimicrobiota bacterium]